MTALITTPSYTLSANLRPVLVMEPALVPVFETAGAPFRVVGDVAWGELDASLRRAPATTVVVVDPYAGTRRGDRFPRVRDLLRSFPSVPVVAAMELRPEMAGDVTMLLEWGVSEVVALGTESTPRALSARLRQAHVRPLKRALEAALSPYAGMEARQILMEHGDYERLTDQGHIVILNNGIEFAATYFVMLLSLFFTGAGRYFSVDFWIRRRFMTV